MAETADRFYGTGRRKCAVARVWISAGTGEIKINGREIENYFDRHCNRAALLRPPQLAEVDDKMNINATVCGGGQTAGQSEALRHGISRALVRYNEELRGVLKRDGLLSRDARIKERKKYGQPGARKRYQFSKR